MTFNRPTPGYSLTQAPGEMPFEQAPQFTDLEDTSEYLFDEMTKPKTAANIATALEGGMPAEGFTNQLLFEGVANGKFTMDLALLLAPRVLALTVAVAKRAGATDFAIMNDEDVSQEILGTEKLVEEPTEMDIEEAAGGFLAEEEAEIAPAEEELPEEPTDNYEGGFLDA